MALVSLAAQCLSISVDIVNTDIIEQSIQAQLLCLTFESRDYDLSALIAAGYSTEDDRRQFCLLVRLFFEDIVARLLVHFQVPINNAIPLADRVLFLKPHIQPAVRLNAFFDLREYSSPEEPSLRNIEKLVIAVRSVLEQVALMGLSPVGAPLGYKTKLCRNWQKYGTCPHADKCVFAHGV